MKWFVKRSCFCSFWGHLLRFCFAIFHSIVPSADIQRSGLLESRALKFGMFLWGVPAGPRGPAGCLDWWETFLIYRRHTIYIDDINMMYIHDMFIGIWHIRYIHMMYVWLLFILHLIYIYMICTTTTTTATTTTTTATTGTRYGHHTIGGVAADTQHGNIYIYTYVHFFSTAWLQVKRLHVWI